ncbi:MAG: hypothetical protein LBD62_00560 [Candidatus Margulisbacteria bacterium]|jgi:hypothetical protein|nr:hypothetical protein [Candidatus Margulisiibacteriota bacterium]
MENNKKYAVIDIQKSMKNINTIRKNMEKAGIPVNQLDTLFAQLQNT